MSETESRRRIAIFGATHCGHVREMNEDHILVGRAILNSGAIACFRDFDDASFNGLLAAVADGVGGYAGGALASRLALTALESAFHAAPSGDPRDALFVAAAQANQRVLEAAASPGMAGMGTTLAGVCLTRGGCLVFHAGDSRVYRFRNGYAKQLTVDDSVAALTEAAGLDAGGTSRALTNCLGSREFALHVADLHLRDKDLLLACSDGLHEFVDVEAMEDAARDAQAPEHLGRRLLEEALRAGGHDNIALIVLAVQDA